MCCGCFSSSTALRTNLLLLCALSGRASVPSAFTNVVVGGRSLSHAFQRFGVGREHASWSRGLDLTQRCAFLRKAETLAHTLDHHCDFVVDRGLAEIEGHEGILKTAHDDEIDTGHGPQKW